MYRLKQKGMKITFENGEFFVYSICKGLKNTPYYCGCVDHGTYFVIAMYSYYVRIDKNTMQVTSNKKTISGFVGCELKAELVSLPAAA